MNRAFSKLTLPTAVLASAASACTATPMWIPPSQTAQNWEDFPEPQVSLVPPVMAVGPRWLLPADNFWSVFQKETLLSVLGDDTKAAGLPDIRGLEVVQHAERAASVVAAVGMPTNTMWVVDLRGAASVAFGATLSNLSQQAVAPIITFNNWPAEDEVVPAEETLAALLTMQPRPFPGSPLATNDSGIPVFLLDAWRLAYRDEQTPDDVTDNRYMLTPADMPAPETLLSRGINQVLYVVEDLRTTTTEEDDLQQTFLAYQAAGIEVFLVDLQWLSDIEQPARWEERMPRMLLNIDPGRITVCRDPRFYRRAHAGFGGMHVYLSSHGFAFHGAGWGGGGHGGGG